MTTKINTECTVRCSVISGRSMTITTIEKTFKSRKAMDAWLDRQEEAGKLHRVIAISA